MPPAFALWFPCCRGPLPWLGADGLIVEVHPCPEKALSDGNQSLTFDEFRHMMKDLQPYLDLEQEARQLRPQLLAVGGAD